MLLVTGVENKKMYIFAGLTAGKPWNMHLLVWAAMLQQILSRKDMAGMAKRLQDEPHSLIRSQV